MRKLALCLAVVGLAGPARAQERPPVIRLAALIAEARQKNPEVRAARAQARAATSSVAPAGALDDPMLMVELWNAPVDFSTVPVMFQLTQTVPLGGKRAARRDLARGAEAMARAQAEARLRDVEAALAKAYFDLFLAERTIEVDREIERTLRSLLGAASARIAAGRGEQSEALRAQAELLKVESDREAAQARRVAANAKLVALLDRPPGSEMGTTAEPSLVPALPAFAELRDRALSGRPELWAARAAIAQAQAHITLAEAQRVPDLGLIAGEMHTFGMSGPGVSDFLFVGLQGNLPIFGASKNQPQQAAASAQLEAARADLKALENKVLAEVADAAAEVAAEKRQVELHHQLIPVARQALHSATAAYVAGRGSFLMVLDADRDLQMHELDLATHMAMYEQRLAELERAVAADLGLAQAAQSGTREEHEP